MRRTALALGLTLALAGPCLAESNRGAFAVDAMVAPSTGFGFAYYVTDGLSLRPWLGLGYSGYGGFFANVGAQLRYEVGSDWSVSPYLSASAQYSYSEASSYVAAPGRYASGSASQQTLQGGGSGSQLGAGAGLRFRLARSFSLFAEGRVLHASYPLAGYNQGWSTFNVNDQTRGEVVLGATYLFR